MRRVYGDGMREGCCGENIRCHSFVCMRELNEKSMMVIKYHMRVGHMPFAVGKELLWVDRVIPLVEKSGEVRSCMPCAWLPKVRSRKCSNGERIIWLCQSAAWAIMLMWFVGLIVGKRVYFEVYVVEGGS